MLLDISADLSGPAKLEALREVPVDKLVGSVMSLKLYTFRPCNDGAFFRELCSLPDG